MADKDMPYDPQERHVVDNTPLRIMNSNEGIRNYIPKEDFFNMMSKVFNEIAKTLTNHCGPFSRSALVVSPSGGKYETNTFTKDGRNIIASMNFVSPIEEIIKEMLLYIGSRVDSHAGDGTTSSMFFTATFFAYIANEYKNRVINSRHFAKDYQEFEDGIKRSLSQQKITLAELCDEFDIDPKVNIEDYQKLIAAIATYQTLSSSNGDMELAKCMYDIYLQSPQSTWSYVSIYNQKYENTQKYSVNSEHSDYFITGDILTPGVLNHNLYSEYKDTADVLVLPQDIPGGGILADEINTFLDKLPTMIRNREIDIVIVAKSFDPSILRKINDFNRAGHNTKIVAFQCHDKFSITSVSMNLIGLSLCGGIDPYIVGKSNRKLDQSYFIPSVDVHYRRGQVHFTNLFVREEGMIGHPFYHNPNSFPPYTYFLKSLENRVNDLNNDINQTQYANEIECLQNQIGMMTFPNRPYLMLGGASHDHAEAIDVVRDCCGAVNASLEHGFICGSSLALMRALYKSNVKDEHHFLVFAAMAATYELIDVTLHGRKTPVDNPNCSMFSNQHLHLLKEVFKLYHGAEAWHIEDNVWNTKADSIFSKFKQYFLDTEKSYKYDSVNILEDASVSVPNGTQNLFGNYQSNNLLDMIHILMDTPEDFFKEEINKTCYPILQPAEVFEQLFSRIGELIIKLITTECIIVPGAVYIKDKDKDTANE